MRTTLTIDDDILRAIHERARAERRTAGQVLSQLAREALTRGGEPDGSPSTGLRHGFPVLPARGRVVTNELIDELRDEESV